MCPQTIFKKKVKSLIEHAAKFAKAKEEKELLPGTTDDIWLGLTVKKTTPEKKLKPFNLSATFMTLSIYLQN